MIGKTLSAYLSVQRMRHLEGPSWNGSNHLKSKNKISGCSFLLDESSYVRGFNFSLLLAVIKK